MNKPKILAIVGSLRKESYNLQLALAAKDMLADRADFEILNFHDVPLFNQDIEFPAPEAVTRVRQTILDADAIWFFTPEYNHFFTGVLKNLIDWLSRSSDFLENSVLSGKPAAISGISLGMSGTAIAQDHFVTLISYLNMNVMNQPRVTIPNAMKQLDEQGKLALKISRADLEIQIEAFLAYLAKR